MRALATFAGALAFWLAMQFCYALTEHIAQAALERERIERAQQAPRVGDCKPHPRGATCIRTERRV